MNDQEQERQRRISKMEAIGFDPAAMAALGGYKLDVVASQPRPPLASPSDEAGSSRRIPVSYWLSAEVRERLAAEVARAKEADPWSRASLRSVLSDLLEQSFEALSEQDLIQIYERGATQDRHKGHKGRKQRTQLSASVTNSVRRRLVLLQARLRAQTMSDVVNCVVNGMLKDAS